MEVRGQLHDPAVLPPGKEPFVPMGGPQSQSGHSGGEVKNSQPLPELEHPIIQPANQRYTSELPQNETSCNCLSKTSKCISSSKCHIEKCVKGKLQIPVTTLSRGYNSRMDLRKIGWVRTGFIWLRIGTSGGLLLTR
jgi:hypothetical protein